MSSDNKPGGKDAFDLFPDLMKDMGAVGRAAADSKGPVPSKPETKIEPVSPKARVAPPTPPDISWLYQNEFTEDAKVSEMPTALVLMPEGESRGEVTQVFQGGGYQIEYADSAAEALDKMKFMNVAAVVQQVGFGGSLEADHQFHDHMRWLPMNKRRHIFYVRIGPDFHTLYDLEALTESANLVVNNRDVNNMHILLRKGLQDYEELFGPFINALEKHGKQIA